MRHILPAYPLIALLAATSAEAASPPEKTLRIVESHKIAVPESSGMCWMRNGSEERTLVVVGDKDHTIYFFDKKPGAAPALKRSVELNLPGSGKQSEWESVYADQAGRIFILPESPEVIHVYDTKSAKLLTTLSLSLDDAWRRRLAWDAYDNSQGEGITLLKNGHVLVLKEKEPLKIVEFAPSGDSKAEGFQASLSLESGGEFPLPSGKNLVPVHSWSLAPDQRGIFPDGSGLNVSPKGELYLLSDQGGLIGRIGALDPKKDNFTVSALFRLPEEIRNPEGMVFDADGKVLIASDASLKKKKKKKNKNADRPNFFVLSME